MNLSWWETFIVQAAAEVAVLQTLDAVIQGMIANLSPVPPAPPSGS